MSPHDPQGLPRPGRNLVVCCDGTNNTLTGGTEDTNVLLLYSYLLAHTDPATTSLYYDPGVGVPDAAPPTDLTDLIKRRFERVAGLASGRGVYENIAEGYRFLMREWRGPQDRIYCFGFSRGAFTARCISGMVSLFGVIRPEHEPLLPTLIRIYFSQPPEAEQAHGHKNWRRALARWVHVGLARPGKAASEPAGASEEVVAPEGTRNLLAMQVRRCFGSDDPATRAVVHWVGVWDTVESVGLPILFARDNPATASFHDKPYIRHVRHALALDEHRLPFQPRLYDAPSAVVDGGRTLKQLWFPGVHCDVGGSYSIDTSGLADAGLAWMVGEVAAELGVPPLVRLPTAGAPLPYGDLGMPRRQPFPAALPLRHDALHDTPAWALAGMTVRDLRDHRVATNGEVAAAGGHADQVGVLVDIQAAGSTLPAGPSVWDARRGLWPVVAAVLVALAAPFLSGRSLADPEALLRGESRPAWADAPAAACRFALQQLATLPGAGPIALPHCGTSLPHGLRDPLVRQALMARSPAWAAFWDLFLAGALGYLLARLATRGFTFLAGLRTPGQGRPPWLLVLGVLPMAAVMADVGENLLTFLAVLVQSLDTPWLATGLLVAMAASAWVKVLAWGLALVVFVPLRVAIAVLPTQRIGKVGRKPRQG